MKTSNILNRINSFPLAEVRKILLRDWDPIGIGDNVYLTDEYDRYLPEIIKVLNRDTVTTDLIENYLAHIENGLGMQVNNYVRHKAAISLIELKQKGTL